LSEASGKDLRADGFSPDRASVRPGIAKLLSCQARRAFFCVFFDVVFFGVVFFALLAADLGALAFLLPDFLPLDFLLAAFFAAAFVVPVFAVLLFAVLALAALPFVALAAGALRGFFAARFRRADAAATGGTIKGSDTRPSAASGM
jgi:hypothetical protein